MQLGPSSEETTEFTLKTRKTDVTDLYVRLKLDQNVYIAFRPKIIPQYRSKKCQLADAVLPAEPGQLLCRNLNTRTHHVTQNFLRETPERETGFGRNLLRGLSVSRKLPEPVGCSAMEPRDERQWLAEQVRRLCLETMQRAYEEARMQGLCAEGAFEAAVSAVAMLDLQTLLDRSE